MINLTLNRVLAMLPTLVLVLVLVGGLIHMVPGDPVDALLGEQAMPTDRAALRQELGLNQPIYAQIAGYIGNVAQGDLGASLMTGKPVLSLISHRAGATINLALAAMGVALILGAVGGVGLALSQGFIKQSVDITTLMLVATPSFVLGPMLITMVAVRLNLLPVSGMSGASSLILPALTLGTGLGMVLARFLAESLTRAYATDSLRTAKAKGASPMRQLLHHALPLAAGPVVQILFLQLGMVLTGAVLTEAVFGWPGIGTLLVEALHQRDYPLMQGVLLVISVTYMVCVLLSDLLVAWLDPRLKLPAGVA